jgi:hypothetical protein
MMEITISDHQYALIKQAVQPGNTEFTVWSIKNTSHRTYAAMYRAGLIDKPDYGAKLTDAGKDVAWTLRDKPRQRKFTVPMEAVPVQFRPAPRPLGENQRYALKCLAEHNGGTWYPAAGWVWSNVSTTVRLLDSLVKRGLADKVMKKYDRTGEKYPYYTITDAGRATAR